MLKSDRATQSRASNDACEYSSTYGKSDYWSNVEQKAKKLKGVLESYYNFNDFDDNIDNVQYEITELLTYILPHGGGIDADWNIEFLKNGNIVCHNSYHCMDTYGGYDGWIDFKVKIYRCKEDIFNSLKGVCEGKIQVLQRKGDLDFKLYGDFHLRWNKYAYVKDYLIDIIGRQLWLAMTNRNETIAA